MAFFNSEQRYGSVAQVLHWVMALLIIIMIVLGLYMVRLPINATKLKLYGYHKALGVLVLMLACLRLSWRLINQNPRLPNEMPTWQKLAAHGVHYAFYFFMFALPLTGWMLSSASGLPVSFFGLFLLPDLISPNEHWRFLLQTAHQWLGYGLLLALCAHVGAALQHHFINKDDILKRMLP